MVQDIIIGRSEADKERFGDRGLVLLGKHYVKMGRTTSLSNKIYMDVARAHTIFVVGKKGSGKSYSMGVIAEGMSDLPEEVSKNIAVLILDTMGIFWTMKIENRKDEELLEEWGLEPKGLPITIFTPVGYYEQYKNEGIPTDYPFSIKPSELSGIDWCNTFEIQANSQVGVTIIRAIARLRGENYSIDDTIDLINADEKINQETKNIAISLFENAKDWGLFDENGTDLKDLIKGGQITVLDVSCYATTPGGWGVKGLAIGLIAQKLFVERMIKRKKEELEAVQHGYRYLGEGEEEIKEEKMPIVWLIVDEAHELLPDKGKNAATDALVTILREGRQPGIGLILATQQPGKIHTDVITQSDIVIAHKITAKIDIDALNAISQNYMTKGLTDEVNDLPKETGAAVILDDNSERIYPMRVRPKLSWHGGEAPVAVKGTR